MKNGKNETVTVPYERTDLSNFSINKKIFQVIIDEIRNKTIGTLKHPLSFNPSNIVIDIYPSDNLKYSETKKNVGPVIYVKSTIYFSAKNGFGNEIEGENFDVFYVKNGIVNRELSKQIELTPLKLDVSSGLSFINRKLLAINDKFEFIQITPTLTINNDGIYLIVKSPLERDVFNREIYFFFTYEAGLNNDIKFSLRENYSTNEDKTISYYDLSKEQINVLKKRKLSGMRIENYSESVYCSVDENMQTYFIEFFSLKEVGEIIQNIK